MQTIGDSVPFGLHFDNVRAYKGLSLFFLIGVEMENAFKQWMIDNYSHNEMADIANHGCSGGVGGMIYYTDTCALYQEFSSALHDIIGNYKEEFGDWPKYVTDELGDDVRFANAVVWFCTECISHEITGGLYVDNEVSA